MPVPTQARSGEWAVSVGVREVWVLPVLSQEFNDGPVVVQDGTQVRLRYDYETETGKSAWREVAFFGVEAFMFTGHDSCDEDQVAAYDRLVEVIGSSWLTGLAASRRYPIPTGARHLRIYFDDVGCYEIVATSFVAPSASGS